jgi:soluble lytic murein transglycosylase-like protein
MYSTLVSSLFGARPVVVTSVPFLVLLAFGEVDSPTPPAAPAPDRVDSLRTSQIGALEAPAAVVLSAADSMQLEAKLTRTQLRRPLERYFGRFTTDTALVRRVARAVIREAHQQQVAPSLIAAVLVTENTTLKPWAESQVGAVGLMQVMPMHAGQLGCESADLVDVDSNICHGTKILARNLRRSGSSSVALLRYNGCVRGTNTPDCHRYPGRVLARAGNLREELLAAAEPREITAVALGR